MFLARRKEDQNLAVVDPWTFVHAGTGLAVGLLGFSFWKAMAVAVAYEVIESQSEASDAGRKFFNVSAPETFENQLMDLVVFAVGVRLGHNWNASK